MSSDEREFDKQLSEHVAGELNPQLGRAGRAFGEMIREERRRRQWWISAASLVAASILIAAGLWWMHRPEAVVTHPPQLVEKSKPPVDSPRDVEQLVAWQTIDEGVENIPLKDANALPVHR